jgi:hypothetical protein
MSMALLVAGPRVERCETKKRANAPSGLNGNGKL